MSTRSVKAESYFGLGDALMALAMSSLKLGSESTDGRTLDCCILTGSTSGGRWSSGNMKYGEKTGCI
jgi:hypothetical protein